MKTRSVRSFLVISVGLLVLMVAPTIGLAAGGPFVDDDTSVFEKDIEWLASAGVTKGCNPPTNDRFCPRDTVTREQMAAFMRRFAAFLGAEDGVVAAADDASTLDGKDSSAFGSAADVAALTTTTLRVGHWNANTFAAAAIGTTNGCATNTSGSLNLQIPVDLPDGAAFGSVTVFGVDFSNTQDFSAYFYRVEERTDPNSPGVSGSQLGNTATSGGASFAGVKATIDFGGTEVVEPGETFHLVFSGGSAFDHGFCSLEVTYRQGSAAQVLTGDAPSRRADVADPANPNVRHVER